PAQSAALSSRKTGLPQPQPSSISPSSAPKPPRPSTSTWENLDKIVITKPPLRIFLIYCQYSTVLNRRQGKKIVILSNLRSIKFDKKHAAKPTRLATYPKSGLPACFFGGGALH